MTIFITLIVVFGFGFIVGRLTIKKEFPTQERTGNQETSKGEKITDLE